MLSSFKHLFSSTSTRSLFIFTLLVFSGLSGCTGSPSTLAPSSPEASQVADLFWLVTGISAVIFFVVEGLLIFAVIRFRGRSGTPEPPQIHGNHRLEIAWTIAPALVLALVLGVTVQTMSSVSEQKLDALRVKVVGYQWWWKVEYPDLGITTATDLHVPVGRPVEVELVAADVIHSFWAPELFGKMDVIPGRSTWTRFTASRAGTFRGQCAEFCGVQHANMGFLIIAESPDQFGDWIRRMQEPSATAASGQPARGAQAFGMCMGCHTVAGTQAQGKIGPDLTHFGSRKSIAALTLDNSAENLTLWLRNPQAIKPDSKMPNMNLSEEIVHDLVAYLESLK